MMAEPMKTLELHYPMIQFLIKVNIWKTIYLNCEEIYEYMIDHCSYTHSLSSCEIKAWKKISGLNGFQFYMYDLCNINVVLYQLSYQAN